MEGLHADLGYMECDKMHCRMPVKTCILRQTKGIQFFGGGVNFFVPDECIACKQGKAVLSDHNLLSEKKKPSQWRVYLTCPNCLQENKVHYKKGLCVSCGRAWDKFKRDPMKLQQELAKIRVHIRKYGSVMRKRGIVISKEEIQEEFLRRGVIDIK